MTSVSDWYRAYYREQYADSVRDLLTPRRSEQEVDFIIRHTGVRPPAAIADVACGNGRHALAFARRGFSVVGVDINNAFIAEAGAVASAEGLPVRFVTADMRQALPGPYHLVVSLFHSFGFFDDDDNERVICVWCDQLLPGGYFVLDIWNRSLIHERFEPVGEFTTSFGLHVAEYRRFDPTSSCLSIHYTYTYADGRRYEYDTVHRLYSPSAIVAMLESVQMSVVSTFGALADEPYVDKSRRLVFIAQKMA